MLSDNYIIEGSKGGEKEAHTPVETPNNLLSVAYAKVLIAVAEGELEGNPTGKDIYLNGTPLISENGDSNFGGVTWEWRKGSVDQTHIPGIPEVSNEINVGVELKQVSPWVQQVTKEALSAVRVTLQWSALMQQLSNGDTVGHTIDYAIDLSTNGGPFTLYQQYQVSGKTNGVYERTHRVNLPESDNGWSVRVRRITPNATGSLIQDTMNIKSYAEVVDAKQRYPNTALLFVQFDSRLFGGGAIPKISVKTKGRVVRVPSNYDPASRTYSGTWSGDFKWAWTDNPAWVFFDIVTQDRFGLGSRVTVNQVDKWALYEVAQYCDVMVDDGTGSGGLQPRHTCNIYIQSKADAWEVLRDICSIFNGMMYWNGNQFVAKADKLEPVDDIPTFSRSNVVDGEFQYSSSDERTIFTSALVSYDEPTDHYETQVEAVREDSQILRWGGDRQTTMAAIGCTSRAEAQRKGKYTLITNLFNRGVTFKTGLQGLNENVAPGSIIGIADPLISGKPFTGRLVASTPTVVTLDRLTEAKAGDLLFVNLKDGSQQARTIRQVSGRVVTVTTAYSESLPANAVWYLEAEDLKSQLFKVIKVTSPDESIYEINAVEYNTSKYAAIDNGARLEPRPVSKVPPQAQKKPEPVTITSNTFIEQTMAVTSMTITWPQTENAVLYECQWRVGQGDWVDLGTTGALEFNVRGIYTGLYIARVRAHNALGIKSQWALSATTDLQGKPGLPAALASLTVTPLIFGMRLNWAFPNGVEDTARTEIMYSKTTSFAQATKLGDFAYPQNTHDINGLAAGITFYFWARLVDRTGNVGPYFPLTNQIGVVGKSSTNIADYEEYFKDQITESALGQQLAEKIDKIEVIEGDITRIDVEVDAVKVDVSGLHKDVESLEVNLNWLDSQLGGIENQLQNDIDRLGSTLQGAIDITNADLGDLKDDVNDLNNEVSNLQDQVNSFVDALEYNPAQTYSTGEAVRQGQKLYQALKDVPLNTSPPNPEYWKDVGDIVTDLGALSARVTINENTITQQGDTLTAQGQKLDALTVRVGDSESKISGNTSAITNLTATVTQQGNNITSQGQAITALESDVSNLQTGQEGNATAIESLRTTVTTQGDLITSQGQAITTLGSTVDTLQTDVNGVKSDVKAQGSAITGLTTTVTQQGNTISSHSNSITALEGKVNTITTDLDGLETKVDANSTAVTNLQNTVTQQGSTITAQGQDITTLKADVTTVQTDVNGLKTTVTGQGTAISNLQTTVTQHGNDITANSNNITTLTAEVKFNALENLYDKAETDQQIGDALNIAEGAASATQSLTAEVTKQGDVITAQGQLLTELNASLSDIDGNIVGVGAAIESLKTTVTSQGNTITSQGQSITDLSNSLTLVDGKATDANTKADSALAQVVTKADASAVTALTTRVTNAEGKITSQGSLITELNNSLTITNGNVTAAKDAADAAQADATDALTQVVTKADASAVTQLETRVTSAEGKITSQGVLTTQLNNSLETTNQNVTAAQQAAQAASDKAGAKGEVIYGTSAPAADKRLPQNLWIDTTNGNNTPKRWDGTDWVAVTDKVATDAAAAAADALSKVATKADSSALQALSNTVTQQGNTITAQGQAITNLDASLTTTNGNVTAAQNAANAANTLAGGKGKVFFQNAEPATAERLAQNLWIDTTNGANTPKRWNGTAWVAVTDKVAVEAAAAAQNALTQVALKADATAVQALTNTVTQQGNDIAATNSTLTNLKTTVEFNALEDLYDKAETDQQIADAFNIATGAASATQELKSSVERIDGVITAQAESITELQASIEGIDVGSVATAVQNLKVVVEQQGNTISSQGQSITQLNNSLTITDGKATDALGKADNALAQVSTKAEASAVQTLTNRVTSVEGTVTTQGQSITQLNNSLTITTGKADQAQADASSALTKVATKADASAVTSLTNRVTSVEGKVTTQGESITQLNNSLTITNGNVTAAKNAANAANTLAGGKGKVIVQNATPGVADRLPQNLWIDTTGGANTPKRWLTNAWVAVTDKVATDAAKAASDAMAAVALKADASALNSLSTTVTQQGNTLTAQATQITGLTTKVDNNTAAVQTISNATATLTDSVANMQTSVQAIASGLREDDGSGDLSDALQAWNSSAKFSSDIKVLATDTQAAVTKTDTLEASVGETNASVQVLAQAQADLDGKASASWSVKLQVNSQGQYVAAGIGLGIENGPAGLQSSFLVSADRFAVVNGVNDTVSAPFVVQSGQVYIKDAFIANGSITMLKIGDALQSDDYVEGVQGWRLRKSGTFEINGSVAGQGRMSMTNRSLRVYDENNVKRVQLGDLSE